MKEKLEKRNMREKNHDRNFDFFNIDSNEDEYYLIKKSKDLQQILNEATFESISLFTNEVNQFVQDWTQFRISYSEKIEKDQQHETNFEKWTKKIEEFLDQKNEVNEYLTINQLTNNLEKILENDVSTKQQISKKTASHERFQEVTRWYTNSKEYYYSRVCIKKKFDKHSTLHFIDCYENDCQIHLYNKEETEYFSKKSKTFKLQRQNATLETRKDKHFW